MAGRKLPFVVLISLLSLALVAGDCGDGIRFGNRFSNNPHLFAVDFADVTAKGERRRAEIALSVDLSADEANEIVQILVPLIRDFLSA